MNKVTIQETIPNEFFIGNTTRITIIGTGFQKTAHPIVTCETPYAEVNNIEFISPNLIRAQVTTRDNCVPGDYTLGVTNPDLQTAIIQITIKARTGRKKWPLETVEISFDSTTGKGICPQCGEDNLYHLDKYCHNCGARIRKKR